MKKALLYFFTTLGVIFFVLILFAIYFVVADPLNIKPLINMITEQSAPVSNNNDSTTKASENPLLTPEQASTLQQFGIDPSTLPSKITPEMEACFYQTLGTQRANAIKAGAEPTAADFLKARACLN